MPEPLTDEREAALIANAQAGEQDAFNELAAHYRPMLLEYAQQWLGDRDKAEDATQNALIFAWQRIGEFYYRPHKFKHWLVAAARNTSHEIERGYNSPAWLSVYYKIKAEQGVLPDRVEQSILSEGDHIDFLSRTEREVMDLKEQGLTTAEIARQLSISRATVYVHTRNAKKKLPKDLVVSS